MFGLKTFVRVQTFQRGPSMPPHNFCHPALKLPLFIFIGRPKKNRCLSFPCQSFLCIVSSCHPRRPHQTLYWWLIVLKMAPSVCGGQICGGQMCGGQRCGGQRHDGSGGSKWKRDDWARIGTTRCIVDFPLILFCTPPIKIPNEQPQILDRGYLPPSPPPFLSCSFDHLSLVPGLNHWTGGFVLDNGESSPW